MAKCVQFRRKDESEPISLNELNAELAKVVGEEVKDSAWCRGWFHVIGEKLVQGAKIGSTELREQIGKYPKLEPLLSHIEDRFEVRVGVKGGRDQPVHWQSDWQRAETRDEMRAGADDDLYDKRYVRGIAPGTQPADRNIGKPPTENQMLLDMEIRLQLTGADHSVVLGEGNIWSSRPDTRPLANGEENPPAGEGKRMVVTIPAAALEPRGPEVTASNLGLLVEMTTHAAMMKEWPPKVIRTGDPACDDALANYTAAAANDQVTEFARTGTFRASSASLPEADREPLCIDLEYFDKMIAKRFDKRFGEADAYRAADAVESARFDPARSAQARQVHSQLQNKTARQAERAPAFPAGHTNPTPPEAPGPARDYTAARGHDRGGPSRGA